MAIPGGGEATGSPRRFLGRLLCLLPADATGIDGIYEIHDGSHVAYQVKYRQKQNLSFANQPATQTYPKIA